jgi:hypothetical protein
VTASLRDSAYQRIVPATAYKIASVVAAGPVERTEGQPTFTFRIHQNISLCRSSCFGLGTKGQTTVRFRTHRNNSLRRGPISCIFASLSRRPQNYPNLPNTGPVNQ